MKENYMGKTMPDCSLWCNYSITFTPKYPFFSSDCILKFGPLHLLLSITSKRIKLQMWDCAQKKALEKIFNLVTDKSCLKLAKGAKMSYRKTCVFFNSGSIYYSNAKGAMIQFIIVVLGYGWHLNCKLSRKEQWPLRYIMHSRTRTTSGCRQKM